MATKAAHRLAQGDRFGAHPQDSLPERLGHLLHAARVRLQSPALDGARQAFGPGRRLAQGPESSIEVYGRVGAVDDAAGGGGFFSHVTEVLVKLGDASELWAAGIAAGHLPPTDEEVCADLDIASVMGEFALRLASRRVVRCLCFVRGWPFGILGSGQDSAKALGAFRSDLAAYESMRNLAAPPRPQYADTWSGRPFRRRRISSSSRMPGCQGMLEECPHIGTVLRPSQGASLGYRDLCQVGT